MGEDRGHGHILAHPVHLDTRSGGPPVARLVPWPLRPRNRPRSSPRNGPRTRSRTRPRNGPRTGPRTRPRIGPRTGPPHRPAAPTAPG
ncbi:hypothetical protein F5983_24275 [Streptomyces arboris]|uniref:Uncharacterized protein n=1 Tax=Streptomyces arboris TaxID=2600619 RepID=A0A5N5EMW8_9ACTN|nr:hypothetical protein F5983_24275 [Streptomyces arboris]